MFQDQLSNSSMPIIICILFYLRAKSKAEKLKRLLNEVSHSERKGALRNENLLKDFQREEQSQPKDRASEIREGKVEISLNYKILINWN